MNKVDHPSHPWVSIHIASHITQVPLIDLRNMVARDLLKDVGKSGPENTSPRLLSFHHMVQAYYAYFLHKQTGIPLVKTNKIGLEMTRRFKMMHGDTLNEDTLEQDDFHGYFYVNQSTDELEAEFLSSTMRKDIAAQILKAEPHVRQITFNDMKKYLDIKVPFQAYVMYPSIDSSLSWLWLRYTEVDLEINRLAIEGRMKAFPPPSVTLKKR